MDKLDECLRIIRGYESDRVRDLYSEEGNLVHYLEVYDRLWQKYRDEEMSLAGFLHSLTPDEARQLLSWLVSPRTIKIMSVRARLMALRPCDSELPKRLIDFVLPQFFEEDRQVADAGVRVFVEEQLHHLDRMGLLSDWTQKFRSRAQPLPDLPSNPYFRNRFLGNAQGFGEFAHAVLAPTAGYIGLAHERRVARNAGLWYCNPTRMKRLVDFAVEVSDPAGWVQHALDLVRRALESTGLQEVRWDWRHVASLSEDLESESPSDWVERLERWGYVTVICTHPPDCYGTLCHLHTAFRHRRDGLVDHLSEPATGRRRALQSVLRPGTATQLEMPWFTVRIIPREADRLPMGSDSPRAISTPHSGRVGESPGGITAFTITGQSVPLPYGARVLNFALATCEVRIPYLVGATVNNEFEPNILRKLEDNDVVQLEVDVRAVHPLPRGWEQHVPPQTVGEIRRAHQAYYPLALGRMLVRDWLGRDAWFPHMDEADLDRLLVRPAELMKRERIGSQDREGRELVHWWLTEIGHHEDARRSHVLTGRSHVTDDESKQFERTVRWMVTPAPRKPNPPVPVPEVMQAPVAGWEAKDCYRCQPTETSRCITWDEDGVLVVHRMDARCGRGGVPIPDLVTPADHLLVRYSKDPQVQRQIFEILHEFKVGVGAFVCRPLAPCFYLLSLEVDLDRNLARTLTFALKSLQGVHEVYATGEEIPEWLISHLPSNFEPDFPRQGSPYNPGQPVRSDEAHYGHWAHQVRLKGICDLVAGEKGGGVCFIRGHKDIGKTSLMRWLERQMTRQWRRQNWLVCSYSIPGHGSWQGTQLELAGCLRDAVKEALRRLPIPIFGVDRKSIDTYGLEELVRCVDERLKAPIAILLDEVVGLVAGMSRRELTEFRRFVDWFRVTPGHLVVMAGRTEDFDSLSQEKRDLLGNGRFEQVHVNGLSDHEVQELLEARKQAFPVRIIVTPQVVKRVMTITGGNPYGASKLGDAMYQAACKRRGLITYDSMALRHAEHLVALDDPNLLLKSVRVKAEKRKRETGI